MKQNYLFTQAEKSDIPLLKEIMKEYYIFENLPFDGNSTEQVLRELIENNSKGRIWLLKNNSKVIGYLVLTFGYSMEYKGDDAFIDEFYIIENYRGKGAGKLALEFAEKICKSTGIKALHLEVEKKNTNARGFYRKNGYCDNERCLFTKLL